MALAGGAALISGSACRGAAAETLDRVVASVDNVAITRHEVETAIQFELFLEGKPATSAPGAAALEAERDHLIDQVLLLQEADAENISADDPATSPGNLADFRKKFESETAFNFAFASLGLTTQQVALRLRDRQRILRLIDQRLRPSAVVEPDEIEAYYKNTFLPELARQGRGSVPALAAVESRIQEILVQKKIDQLLEAWLKNLKQSHRVRLFPF